MSTLFLPEELPSLSSSLIPQGVRMYRFHGTLPHSSAKTAAAVLGSFSTTGRTIPSAFPSKLDLLVQRPTTVPPPHPNPRVTTSQLHQHHRTLLPYRHQLSPCHPLRTVPQHPRPCSMAGRARGRKILEIMCFPSNSNACIEPSPSWKPR